MSYKRKTGAESGATFDRVWRWKNRLPGRFGTRCRILADLGNRLWIEFEKDGFRTYCSYFAVRRIGERDRQDDSEQLSLL